jgi:hypothetical protein
MRLRCSALLAVCLVVPSLARAQSSDPLAVSRPVEPTTEQPVVPCEYAVADQSASCHRLYGDVEFILWWLREGRVPPLLTTSSAASQGRLDRADTKILYGDDRLQTRHGDRFNGVRATLGYWLDPEGTFGVEASAFFLERDSTHFKAVSDGTTLLARPYTNPDGSQGSEIIGGPFAGGVRTGQFVGYSRIELFGEQANAVCLLAECPNLRVDVLAGARFLQMRDRLDLTATGWLLPAQTTLFGLTDHFRVHNAFYGGQAGLRGEYDCGRWSVRMRGEVALGGDDQSVQAFGDRTFQTPTQKVVQQYGLSVLPSNRGTTGQGDFDVVSEFGVDFGFQVTECLRLFVGYTLLMWNNPLRAGDQVDDVVNLSQPNGPSRPAIPFREDFFWAQGLNLGAEVRW